MTQPAVLSFVDAHRMLRELGASTRLMRHVELVGEAAELLLAALRQQRVPIDEAFVRAGVVLHDVGKTVHPEELSGPGSRHEATGERLLLDHGVDPRIARVCRSHAQWSSLDASLDELVIALSDKLWKGVRRADLEERVIEGAARAVKRDRWDLFIPLDAAFEEIAALGADRLARSHA